MSFKWTTDCLNLRLLHKKIALSKKENAVLIENKLSRVNKNFGYVFIQLIWSTLKVNLSYSFSEIEHKLIHLYVYVASAHFGELQQFVRWVCLRIFTLFVLVIYIHLYSRLYHNITSFKNFSLFTICCWILTHLRKTLTSSTFQVHCWSYFPPLKTLVCLLEGSPCGRLLLPSCLPCQRWLLHLDGVCW